jgi:hypothetical protein
LTTLSEGQDRRRVLEGTQTGDVGLRNRAWRSLDLNELRGASRTLYVRVGETHPPDGWQG